jgi:hypothetical protein
MPQTSRRRESDSSRNTQLRSTTSPPEDLPLLGVRVLGDATAARIASRFRLDVTMVQEALLDAEVRGWVRHFTFGGSAGWSLIEMGRTENERWLPAELDRTDLRGMVAGVHADFVP